MHSTSMRPSEGRGLAVGSIEIGEKSTMGARV